MLRFRVWVSGAIHYSHIFLLTPKRLGDCNPLGTTFSIPENSIPSWKFHPPRYQTKHYKYLYLFGKRPHGTFLPYCAAQHTELGNARCLETIVSLSCRITFAVWGIMIEPDTLYNSTSNSEHECVLSDTIIYSWQQPSRHWAEQSGHQRCFTNYFYFY